MQKTLIALLLGLVSTLVFAADGVPPRSYIKIETTEGTITLELNGTQAPLTVGHFLKLVDNGYYDGIIFHRVIPGFMVQTGGYTPDLELKETDENILNESGNGLPNIRGTVAMARTSDPHSANSQFFINVADNTRLDPTKAKRRGNWGYTVFGKVIEGMDVVDRIASVETGPQAPLGSDVPLLPIVIYTMSRRTFESPKSSFKASSGTCFVVSEQGLIITANHVIAGGQSLEVRLADDRVLTAERVAVSATTDLAILNVDGRTPDYLSLAPSSSARSGDQVFTFGFPAVSILGSEAKFSDGSIASMSGLMGEASHMQTDVAIQPGNSGGPLIALDGRVVGVILSTASVEQFYQNVGALPQGVNWAVKSDYARILASALGPERTFPDRTSAINAARAAVCRIMAK